MLRKVQYLFLRHLLLPRIVSAGGFE
ncbi:TPA: RepA leader peptide Tap [Citrobacter freundii]|nr:MULTISPECIES: RepA leader peptide Tap [Citrobacter]EME8861908.1 RepA leader peptide Tap [Enterobacter mori]MBA7759810.1 RepA leader peptide Tap [Citrobacter sp. RHBSTW-00325]MBA7945577.1 RepA leader peptide Tap [Citrobacter sp. RHBSTW-00271]MBA8132491.1 RepA leader peptide Tap [Citrobacter sp. RHBSTW-00013]MCL5620574.1 RepA leader peptide Tap [Escherichia coli]QLS37648.1 RepA leader peptide Tap [Citrobacter sp. RHBSTW-00903]QLV38776.1 RepA leader peptide Tap [Citrobacter sp. RHBSTW-00424]